jgi:antitoxin component HigA of HigAB toxin-antitoxin module
MSNRVSVSRLPAKSIPETYEELARIYSPRPIRDEQDYEAAVEMVDWLAGFPLNKDQDDFLSAVSTFIAAYEDQTFPKTKIKVTGLSALRYLLEENDLSIKDLAHLLKTDPSVASRILDGQRKLTPDDLRTLANHFCVSTDLFIG